MNVAVLQPRILKWKCTVASEEHINCLWKNCVLGTQLLFFKNVFTRGALRKVVLCAAWVKRSPEGAIVASCQNWHSIDAFSQRQLKTLIKLYNIVRKLSTFLIFYGYRAQLIIRRSTISERPLDFCCFSQIWGVSVYLANVGVAIHLSMSLKIQPNHLSPAQ